MEYDQFMVKVGAAKMIWFHKRINLWEKSVKAMEAAALKMFRNGDDFMIAKIVHPSLCSAQVSWLETRHFTAEILPAIPGNSSHKRIPECIKAVPKGV